MTVAPTAGSFLLPPLTRAQMLTALALTLVWTLLLAWLCRDLLAGYYPIADEWALLANADPLIASPLRWFTHGFADYFEYHAELAAPYASFVRPGFNAVYWMLGLVFDPVSGARLWLNFLAIGACAGLTYLSLAHTGWRLALAFAAVVPLMPGFIPATAHLVPCLAYDPLVAALCLGALLAYQRERLILSAALMLFAVAVKETSLPVAAALPAVYAWQYRHEIFTPRRIAELLLLALPLLAWIALRLFAFEDVSGGTYAFKGSAQGALGNLLRMQAHWPLWLQPPAPWQMVPALDGAYVGRWLLLVANLALVAGLGLYALFRLWRREPLDATLVAFLASDLFMLLVGTAQRYGAVVDVFLVICLARWLGSGIARAAAMACTALFVAGVAAAGIPGWQVATESQRLFVDYDAIARRYVETLRSFPPQTRVIVLNDPTTWHARLDWLAAVTGVQAKAMKVADYACPGSIARIRENCTVDLRPTDDPLRFEFTQSCGFDLCGADESGRRAIDVKLPGGVRLQTQPSPPADAADAVPRWRSATITLDQGGAELLYFDPATRSFHSRHVPGVAQGTAP